MLAKTRKAGSQYFRHVLERNPAMTEARVRLARILLVLGRAQQAHIELQRAIAATKEPVLLYLLTYSPRGVAPDGWHRLEVRVKRRNATVKARPGYLAGPGG